MISTNETYPLSCIRDVRKGVNSHLQAVNWRLLYRQLGMARDTDEISVTSGLHVSAVKQPSSGQCGTYTMYNISVHCMGSHIVYNKV